MLVIEDLKAIVVAYLAAHVLPEKKKYPRQFVQSLVVQPMLSFVELRDF